MKLTYPKTLNVWFKNYPRVLKVTCGPNITELEGPWVEGSILLLQQTPWQA